VIYFAYLILQIWPKLSTISLDCGIFYFKMCTWQFKAALAL